MFYLMTHSTHFIYGYMASDIWLRTILIVRKETRCRHIGYSYRLTASVLLYAPSHRQDNTYHSLCYTSRGALAGTRNSSMGRPHEGSIRRHIAPRANALPRYVPLPCQRTNAPPLSYVPPLCQRANALSLSYVPLLCQRANAPPLSYYVPLLYQRVNALPLSYYVPLHLPESEV